MNLEFFRKIVRHKISWTSVLWKSSCSMWAERPTDITKRIVAFRNFGNARKKEIRLVWHGSVSEHCVLGNWKTSAVTREDAGMTCTCALVWVGTAHGLMEGLVSCIFLYIFHLLLLLAFMPGVHTASGPMGTGPLSPGEKQAGSDSDLSPVIKNWVVSPLPRTSSSHCS